MQMIGGLFERSRMVAQRRFLLRVAGHKPSIRLKW